MRSSFFFRKPVGAMSLLLALTLLLAASCTKTSTADYSDLLKTVPSDASAVVALDVQSLLEKAGCKVADGGKVELSEEMKAAIAADTQPSTRQNVTVLLTGEAGVAHSSALIFSEGEDTYATFMVDDPDAFRKYAEKVTEKKVTSVGGVDICGPLALVANQGWMRLGNTADVDAGEILKFTKLSEAQSFYSHDIATKMMETEKDVVGWADIDALLNLSGRSFSDRAVARMGLSSIFDDAAYVWLETDFGKGKMTADMRILNSKGSDAKCNFPTSKIDVKTVESLGGKADVIFATSVSSKLARQLMELAASGAGGIGAMYSPLLKPIDGTAAFAISSNGQGGQDMRGVITTDGKSPVGDLTSFLSQSFGTVKRDGRFLRMEGKGLEGGQLDVATDSKRLSGAWLACLVSKSVLGSNPGGLGGFSSLLFSVRPDEGSLLLKVELLSDSKENALITYLKSMGK